MNKIDFIQRFNDYLYSLKILIKDENYDVKSLADFEFRFRKERVEFHQQLAHLTYNDISLLENIDQKLLETLEKTQEIERSFRRLLQTNHPISQASTVKKLRCISDLFRSGEDERGCEAFKQLIRDGEESLAGDVFEALWNVHAQPNIWDVGRLSFYNQIPEYRSTPLQKALAIEIAMVKAVRKAFEQKKQDQAYAEFHELPYRLKQNIYALLAPHSEIEIGRNYFFSSDFQQEIKILCLKSLEERLEKTYSTLSDLDLIKILQQDFQETLQRKNEAESTLLLSSEEAKNVEASLLTTLQLTQQAAFKTFLAMKKEIQEQHRQLQERQKEIDSFTNKMIETQFSADVREGILRAEQDLQVNRLKQEKEDLQKTLKSIEDHEFVRLSSLTQEEMFADYVHHYCPYYQVEEVKKFIDEGKQLVEKIQNGQAALIPISERKHSMVPLVWYMLYYAVCKNQGFGQGTLVFRDPGHAIVKFFLACGKPTVYPRLSSHFKERLLPTFFEGKEMVTTYGIDIIQDYKLGLPANKRTVHFSPIETKDGLDWSFLKPEDWGLGDWYQFLGHTWDYLATRPAHFFGDPNGLGDRKEHLPLEMKEAFLNIYSRVTGNNQIPEGVKKFGIAGIQAILESIAKDENIDLAFRKESSDLLLNLQKKYDYLNARNGNEAILGNSFIDGKPPEPHAHQSILESDFYLLKAKDAQVRVKNAAHRKEILTALKTLKKEGQKLVVEKEGQVEEVSLGFQVDRHVPHSPLNKQAIFEQLDKDLNRGRNVKFQVDEREFKYSTLLYQYLHTVEFFSTLQNPDEKERQVLTFMALLQQGVRADLFFQLQTWFEQPQNGVRIKQYTPKPDEMACEIIVKTARTPVIDIKQLFHLQAIEEENLLFFCKEPYAQIEGWMKIDFTNRKTWIGSSIREVYITENDSKIG